MYLLRKLIRSLFVTPESIGKKGERVAANKLEWNNFLGYEGKVLNNVYIPKYNGETTEIDLLYITRKGIVVIESKNYSGFIFGSENQPKWTSCVYAGKNFWGQSQSNKYHFYNPIWQNRGHIQFLNEYLKKDIKTYSLIVFSDHCELKRIDYTSSNVFVCQSHGISQIIRRIWKNNKDVLSNNEIEHLYKQLLPLTIQNEALKLKHIQDVKKKVNNVSVCPMCGGKLVLRTAKQGRHIGKQFYGCSNYPRCTYTKEYIKK